MNYFISDLHFGHKNCLNFDNRPFNTIEEHDEYIIENWNKTVKRNDDVYILGDISWYNTEKTVEIFKQLKGRLHLIKGNHDKDKLRPPVRELFCEICDYKELYLGKKEAIVLSHFPIPCFRNHLRGWYHLYGHVHNGEEYQLMKSVADNMKILYPDNPYYFYNVGCMIPYMSYIPRTLEEIMRANNDL